MKNVAQRILGCTLLLCWVILLSAWEIATAIMSASEARAAVDFKTLVYIINKYQEAMWPLAVLAWLSFAAAILVLLSGLWWRNIKDYINYLINDLKENNK